MSRFATGAQSGCTPSRNRSYGACTLIRIPSSRNGRRRGGTGPGPLRHALLAVLMTTAAGPALAIGDGPRAYQLVPAGSQILTFGYLGLDGNSSIDPGAIIRGSEIDVNVGILQYAKTFEFAGQQAGAFALVPFGELDGTLNSTPTPSFRAASAATAMACPTSNWASRSGSPTRRTSRSTNT